MGILDLFTKPRRDKVIGSKILVAYLDAKFAETAKQDFNSYSRFYPASSAVSFNTTQELLSALDKGYDVVHLFADVSPHGEILDASGSQCSGSLLIQKCCERGVKLLWIASENEATSYIKGFKAGKPLNLVLTVDRRSERFAAFLEGLLRKMSAGDTMPTAWVSLVPQNAQDPRNINAPSCIFVAGRGGVRLR